MIIWKTIFNTTFFCIKNVFAGVGLILQELKNSGHLDDTLIIYTSDNGIPFPNGRTNLYDSGLAEPLLMSSPLHLERRNQVTNSLASNLDIVPTLLDWYGIKHKENNASSIRLTGKSLLPLLIKGEKCLIANYWLQEGAIICILYFY